MGNGDVAAWSPLWGTGSEGTASRHRSGDECCHTEEGLAEDELLSYDGRRCMRNDRASGVAVVGGL